VCQASWESDKNCRRSSDLKKKFRHHHPSIQISVTVELKIRCNSNYINVFNHKTDHFNPSWALKTAKQRTIIQLYGEWYSGRWWVGCYIWYSEEGPGLDCSLPRPLLAVPNVTSHSSTTTVPTSYYSMWQYNCLYPLMSLTALSTGDGTILIFYWTGLKRHPAKKTEGSRSDFHQSKVGLRFTEADYSNCWSSMTRSELSGCQNCQIYIIFLLK